MFRTVFLLFVFLFGMYSSMGFAKPGFVNNNDNGRESSSHSKPNSPSPSAGELVSIGVPLNQHSPLVDHQRKQHKRKMEQPRMSPSRHNHNDRDSSLISIGVPLNQHSPLVEHQQKHRRKMEQPRMSPRHKHNHGDSALTSIGVPFNQHSPFVEHQQKHKRKMEQPRMSPRHKHNHRDSALTSIGVPFNKQQQQQQQHSSLAEQQPQQQKRMEQSQISARHSHSEQPKTSSISIGVPLNQQQHSPLAEHQAQSNTRMEEGGRPLQLHRDSPGKAVTVSSQELVSIGVPKESIATQNKPHAIMASPESAAPPQERSPSMLFGPSKASEVEDEFAPSKIEPKSAADVFGPSRTDGLEPENVFGTPDVTETALVPGAEPPVSSDSSLDPPQEGAVENREKPDALKRPRTSAAHESSGGASTHLQLSPKHSDRLASDGGSVHAVSASSRRSSASQGPPSPPERDGGAVAHPVSSSTGTHSQSGHAAQASSEAATGDRDKAPHLASHSSPGLNGTEAHGANATAPVQKEAPPTQKEAEEAKKEAVKQEAMKKISAKTSTKVKTTLKSVMDNLRHDMGEAGVPMGDDGELFKIQNHLLGKGLGAEDSSNSASESGEGSDHGSSDGGESVTSSDLDLNTDHGTNMWTKTTGNLFGKSRLPGGITGGFLPGKLF